ncbi:unnamed protein product [Amoebophrya sp. A25]|nr:unnamed protein product [Amoebophrya sp. A25]|eukprot:GSA25T00012998001.1
MKLVLPWMITIVFRILRLQPRLLRMRLESCLTTLQAKPAVILKASTCYRESCDIPMRHFFATTQTCFCSYSVTR